VAVSGLKMRFYKPSALSAVRDTSVNRSAVSASSKPAASLIAWRCASASEPYRSARISRWPVPSTASGGYSSIHDADAAIRAVPSAVPPKVVARSAMVSTWGRSSASSSSNIS